MRPNIFSALQAFVSAPCSFLPCSTSPPPPYLQRRGRKGTPMPPLVRAFAVPPLCKGRQGGVEASRGCVSFHLPTPSLQRRGFPWDPRTSFQEPTRFPDEPLLDCHAPFDALRTGPSGARNDRYFRALVSLSLFLGSPQSLTHEGDRVKRGWIFLGR